MGPSTPFIRRPVGTTLLTFGLAAAGAVAFFKLPVSPLPQVDFPTISVQATLPGASPQDVATTVASPLERHLGQIADVTEMTSSSTVGVTRITLQFGLGRDINGAARDVQAAINVPLSNGRATWPEMKSMSISSVCCFHALLLGSSYLPCASNTPRSARVPHRSGPVRQSPASAPQAKPELSADRGSARANRYR